MGASLIRGDVFQGGQRHSPEWPAGSGEQNTSHAHCTQITVTVARQGLEHRIVFAIDGQQSRAMRLHHLHKNSAGHHQRFFVGKQHALTGLRCGQGWLQTGRADNRRHHYAHFRCARNLLQRRAALQYFSAQTKLFQFGLQLFCRGHIHQHRIARIELTALFE